MNLSIVKLGGSLITRKDEPLTPDVDAIVRIAESLAKWKLRDRKLILIHGGGSFGHYYAKNYHLGTTFSHTSAKGVALICNAMLKLHSLILDTLTEQGVFCKTVDASEIIDDRGKLSSNGLQKIDACFEAALTPISFGNVTISKQGLARVISGDEICVGLAKKYHAKSMVFAMDVEGIYPDATLKGKVIPVVNITTSISSDLRKFDVTGGVKSKLEVGRRISDAGTDVYFVNGQYPRRILAAIEGSKTHQGTYIPKKNTT